VDTYRLARRYAAVLVGSILVFTVLYVVVCTATTHTESLIDELVDRDVPYVIVEPDRETATDLFDRLDAILSPAESGSRDP